MNKIRVSAQFLLYFLIMMFLMVIGCSSSGSGLYITYNISGTVTGANNVTITLTGPSPGSTTTDASGKYSFKGTNGTYTVVPSKTGYEFNPISRVVVVNGADVTVDPFAATSIGSTPTYTISGTVTGASDVILTLTGDKTGAVATHPDGTYSFPAVENGSYTVVPSKTGGYAFNPISSAVTVSGADIKDINFAATYIGSKPTYTISGTVTGAVPKGVKITLIGDETGSVATISDGTYSFPPVMNGTYTVVPWMPGYTFSPISRVVVVNGADVTVPNFLEGSWTGPIYTISGKVTLNTAGLKNVTITLGGANTGAVATASDGTYSFPPLPGDNSGSYIYTVKPYFKGYSFKPYNHIISLTGNSTGKNFEATLGAYTQDDLVGKWNLHMLKAGTKNIWARRILIFAASSDDNLTAVLTSASSCKDSSGSTACPLTTATADPDNADPSKRTYPLKWKINPSTGEIIESGTNALTANHLTMSSNKNFIAGTDGDINVEKQVKLMIAQKSVDGISYNNGSFNLWGGSFLQGDAQNDQFVYHQLSVGADNTWSYGKGATILGNVSITIALDSNGNITAPAWGNLSVDSTGVVTISGMTDFNGFLSDDKKTIVGTFDDGSDYKLLIIQITDRSDYPIGSLPAGTMFDHMLAIGADVPFWAHATVAVTVAMDGSGTMSFGNWVSSASSISAPSPYVGCNITASGGVTITGSPTFDGQISDDGLFMVGTQTFSTGVYSLIVDMQ